MELDQTTAFLGAFVASVVLAVVLAYVGRITQFRMALDLWSASYAANAARLLVYSIVGIAPSSDGLFFFGEWCQVLQSVLLLLGTLSFVGRSPSIRRHLLPAAGGTALFALFMAFAWDGGPARIVPFYGLSAVVLAAAGLAIARCKEIRPSAGRAFTAAILILWGLHKLSFMALPAGFSMLAQIRFMVSAGFYTAAAIGFAIMALSVYHRRLARAAIENAAYFRRMFDDAPVGYQSLDQDGTIVAVNQRWLDMLGYAQDEVIGRNFGDFLSPANQPKFPARFAEFKRVGTASGVEFELVRKDGRKIIGAFDGRINPGGENGALRTHCVLNDVTERREKENLVGRFGRIIDQTFNEVFVFDAETLKFIYANKGALTNTGFSLDELRTMTPLDLKPDVTPEAFEAVIAPIRVGKGEMTVFESRHRRKDGTIYDVEVRLQFMADEVPAVFVAVVQDISVRKEAEVARKKSEGLMRSLMDHSPASICVKDTARRLMFVNREFERRNGLTAAEVIGKTADEFLSPEQAAVLAERERLALDERRTVQEEIDFELPGGKRCFLLSVKFPVFDLDGALLGVGSVSTDISERKRAELALRESEARFQAIMDHSPAAIILKDPEGRFVLANPDYLCRTGKTLSDVLGRTLAEVEGEAVAREAEIQERQVLEAGRPQVFQVTRPSPDGDSLRVAVVRFVVPAEDGSVAGLGAIGFDVSEWRKAEEARMVSEARLQAIMDHSPASIFLKDGAGRIMVANREYLRRRGLAAEDVLGRTSVDLEAGDVAKEIHRQEQEVLEAGTSKMFNVVRHFADGRDRTLAIVRFPVLAADGNVLGVGGIGFDVSEWKRTEEALTLSEARLQAILDHAPAEITLKDRDGRYLIANKAYLMRKGCKVEEVVGKRISEFSSEAEAQEIRAQDEQVISTGRSWNYQGVRAFADGSKGTFAIVRFPLFDGTGELTSVGVVSIDVTRERQAETALRENEEKLRLALQSTGEGIYAVDLDGRCTLCNLAAARVLGYEDPDELLDHDIHQLIHHSRADGTPYPLDECRIHSAISTGQLIHADDEVFWRRDGRPIPVEFRSNPVIHDGTTVGTVVSFADISERKRAEAWLLRLSQSVEQSPFGVIITDAEVRIEYANPSFLRETGYTLEELKGKKASIQNAEGLGGASDREILEKISGGREWRGEVRHRRKNGEIYWASILISPIRDKAGNPIAYVSISEDISDRRRMAEHLRQAQKMEAVGQLTGGIAHDFNNILSVILTSAECLADDLADNADMSPLVATIVRAVHRAAGLTQRLLAFSRRQDLSPTLTDLGAVVHDMVDMLRRSLGETIDVSIDVEADVPPVIVDRGQFENALLNLAVNARDAMPQGGALKVGVARGNAPISGNGMNGGGKGFVCVTVTDTGTGMPPDVVERVFEPFFTTKAKGQGTGLGLSMVYGFVRQSGGDILVDSVKNEGTLFRLFFPVAEGEQDDSAEQEATAGDDTAILPPLTIVLAEDDGGVRTATKYILDNTGHRVVDAANGSEALDILKRLPAVDMLLTDVIMPGGMSGRDLATAAQALNPNLKVLFTSGYADGRLSMGDIVPGMTAFLPKPYTKESLINAIRALWFDRGPEEAGR